MTDNEIKKTEDTEVNKIKAIYPHIVASLVDEKPYYCIRWYDIEHNELNIGYGSFNLMFVREWYEKHFEVVEKDIAGLINRLQAEKMEQESEIKILKDSNKNLQELYYTEKEKVKKAKQKVIDIAKVLKTAKAEAYKEFAEKAVEQVEKARQKYQRLCKEQGEEMEEHMHIHFNGITKIINNLLKEKVGEDK